MLPRKSSGKRKEDTDNTAAPAGPATPKDHRYTEIADEERRERAERMTMWIFVKQEPDLSQTESTQKGKDNPFRQSVWQPRGTYPLWVYAKAFPIGIAIDERLKRYLVQG